MARDTVVISCDHVTNMSDSPDEVVSGVLLVTLLVVVGTINYSL